MTGKKAILMCALALTAGLVVTPICDAKKDKGGAKAGASASASGDVAKMNDPIVLLNTSKGPIKIKVFNKEAPITGNNFLDLVQRGFYNGLTFHRYDPGFVIQGGDPEGTGSGNFVDPKTHKTRHIKLEKIDSLKHDAPGTVAMARTDNPDSASCQFYITLKATPFLDNPPGYAVFGKVVDGMDAVMKIRKGDKIVKATIEG